MPWLKKAAEAPRNEKLWELSDGAYRLYDGAMHYAAEHLTDGHVPTSRIGTLKPKAATPAQISELVSGRLWHRLPDLRCESCLALRKQHRAAPLARSGFIVHDFLAYNPSKSEWDEREQRRIGLAHAGGAARAAQAARAGGRFAPAAAPAVAPAVRPAVLLVPLDRLDQPQHQPSAGENAPAAPAVAPADGPAVPPPPYSVPRNSEYEVRGTPDPDDAPIPDEPRGTDRYRDLGTTRSGLRPIAAVIERARVAR
jgi:hypothetical protein